MSKPIAVFDLDGTVFRSSLVIELANLCVETHVMPPEIQTEYDDTYRQWKNRKGSYDEYLWSLVETFDNHLEGLEVEKIEVLSKILVDKLAQETYRYTRNLIENLKNTHILLAISGSPAPLVKYFSEHHGFSDYSATEFHQENGIYTGKFTAGDHDKAQILKKLLKKHNLNLEGSIGVGDTASDVKFLELVENPIAFNPNDKLLQTAQEKKWEIVIERKNVAYKLKQRGDGYRLEETIKY